MPAAAMRHHPLSLLLRCCALLASAILCHIMAVLPCQRAAQKRRMSVAARTAHISLPACCRVFLAHMLFATSPPAMRSRVAAPRYAIHALLPCFAGYVYASFPLFFFFFFFLPLALLLLMPPPPLFACRLVATPFTTRHDCRAADAAPLLIPVAFSVSIFFAYYFSPHAYYAAISCAIRCRRHAAMPSRHAATLPLLYATADALIPTACHAACRFCYAAAMPRLPMRSAPLATRVSSRTRPPDVTRATAQHPAQISPPPRRCHVMTFIFTAMPNI